VLHRVFRHVRVLLHVELTIAAARVRVTMHRSIFYALAGLIALFGIGMLNVAAFFAGEAHWGPVGAAVAVAVGDFFLALIVTGVALAVGPGADLDAAVELRQAALDGIDAELAASQEPLAWLSRAARNPIDTALPVVMIPLITAIVRGLRKNKKGAA